MSHLPHLRVTLIDNLRGIREVEMRQIDLSRHRFLRVSLNKSARAPRSPSSPKPEPWRPSPPLSCPPLFSSGCSAAKTNISFLFLHQTNNINRMRACVREFAQRSLHRKLLQVSLLDAREKMYSWCALRFTARSSNISNIPEGGELD